MTPSRVFDNRSLRLLGLTGCASLVGERARADFMWVPELERERERARTILMRRTYATRGTKGMLLVLEDREEERGQLCADEQAR